MAAIWQGVPRRHASSASLRDFRVKGSRSRSCRKDLGAYIISFYSSPCNPFPPAIHQEDTSKGFEIRVV